MNGCGEVVLSERQEKQTALRHTTPHHTTPHHATLRHTTLRRGSNLGDFDTGVFGDHSRASARGIQQDSVEALHHLPSVCLFLIVCFFCCFFVFFLHLPSISYLTRFKSPQSNQSNPLYQPIKPSGILTHQTLIIHPITHPTHLHPLITFLCPLTHPPTYTHPPTNLLTPTHPPTYLHPPTHSPWASCDHRCCI